jgi:Leucine-rich repeat (LRR) protein
MLCENLKLIDLRQNGIKTLPKEVCDLKNLERLYVDENRLKDLPGGFGKL